MISSSYAFKNIKNRNPISFRLQILHLSIYRILITQLYNISKIQKIYIFITASKRDFENLFFLFKKFFKNCIIKLLKGGF